jgi:hypothetical protein
MPPLELCGERIEIGMFEELPEAGPGPRPAHPTGDRLQVGCRLTVRNGKVVRAQRYADRAQAMKAACLSQ